MEIRAFEGTAEAVCATKAQTSDLSKRSARHIARRNSGKSPTGWQIRSHLGLLSLIKRSVWAGRTVARAGTQFATAKWILISSDTQALCLLDAQKRRLSQI